MSGQAWIILAVLAIIPGAILVLVGLAALLEWIGMQASERRRRP